jgi:hypothetical protein
LFEKPEEKKLIKRDGRDLKINDNFEDDDSRVIIQELCHNLLSK